MGWPELCQSDVTLSDRPWKHFAHLLMSQVAASQLGKTQPDLRGCYLSHRRSIKELVAGLFFLL